ncbi:MAG: N-acetylglucosamine-6-phosphate deacetylase [Halanaerobiaceae bacterium]
MKIYRAEKIIAEEEVINDGFLVVEKGKIKEICTELAPELEDFPVTDFGDMIISPGFIDIHCHGGMNYGLGEGDSKQGLINWSKFKAENGVTGFLPTTASLALKAYKKVFSQIKEVLSSPAEAPNILGLHLEGPFFTPGQKIGAQDPRNIKEEFPEEYSQLFAQYEELIHYLSFDPQHKDASRILNFGKKHDLVLGAGHTEIMHQEFAQKKAHGYSVIVHTFNGMKGLHHRNPGLAYSACMDDELYAEIICDGLHISLPMLKLFFELKDPQKAVLITDAMRAAGLKPENTSSFGDRKIKIDREGRALLEDGTLAGSTLTMDRAVARVTKKVGLSLKQAVEAASLNPARLLGIEQTKGSLKAGKDADFIVFDQDISVQETYLQGKKIT